MFFLKKIFFDIKKTFVCFFDTLKPFFRLYRKYVRKYLLYLIVSGILMVIVALLTSGIAYIVGPILNKVFVEKNKSLLGLMCCILVIVYIVKTGCSYIQGVCLSMINERVMVDLRIDVFNKIIKMPMKNFNKLQSGKITSVFLNDVRGVCDGIEELFVTSIKDFVTVVFLVILVFYNNFLLAAVSMCVYPVVFFPLKKIISSTKTIFSKEQDCLQSLVVNLADVTNGMKTIKSYTAEQIEIHKMKHLLIQLTKISLKIAKKRSAASPSMELVSGLSIALVIFIGGWQTIHGYSDVGSFFTFFAALVMAHRPARSLSGISLKFTTSLVCLNRIFFFMDNLENENLNTGIKPDLTNAVIRFNNVGFSYFDNRENFDTSSSVALRDVSFEIKPKQKIAFVGLSGSGKSTVAGLLMRLYDCENGSITINKHCINDISLSWIRENITYVGQDNFLFDDTIKNNILYGFKNKQIDDAKLYNAVEFAQVNFLQELKNGIDEKVGHNGCRLSVGQGQRVAIARAVFKDSPIVIFDEATSALDINTEKEIRDAIFNKMKNKTVIIIAHRLSTIVDCDEIYVMKNGKIIEHGKHLQLINDPQALLYRSLWNNLNNV